MDRWDIFIILVAAYVAVMTLVRLMARRHNQMLDHIREQLSKNKNKKKSDDQPAQRDRGAA